MRLPAGAYQQGQRKTTRGGRRGYGYVGQAARIRMACEKALATLAGKTRRIAVYPCGTQESLDQAVTNWSCLNGKRSRHSPERALCCLAGKCYFHCDRSMR